MHTVLPSVEEYMPAAQPQQPVRVIRGSMVGASVGASVMSTSVGIDVGARVRQVTPTSSAWLQLPSVMCVQLHRLSSLPVQLTSSIAMSPEPSGVSSAASMVPPP
jgi:phosphate/sulfate permease